MSLKPVHHLLVNYAPIWVLEEANKWTRVFSWKPKTRCREADVYLLGKIFANHFVLVSYEVKHLRKQGLALTIRWEWPKRTDMSRPWQGLPHIKYVVAVEVLIVLSK
jgi:hypothetical protein